MSTSNDSVRPWSLIRARCLVLLIVGLIFLIAASVMVKPPTVTEEIKPKRPVTAEPPPVEVPSGLLEAARQRFDRV